MSCCVCSRKGVFFADVFAGSRSELTLTGKARKQFAGVTDERAWSKVVDYGGTSETDRMGAWSEILTKSCNAGKDSALEAHIHGEGGP